MALTCAGPEKWKNDEQRDKKKKNKNSEGTSCRGDGDGCKSGGGTGQEMRRGRRSEGARERVGAQLCLFSILICVLYLQRGEEEASCI